jgi:hypothetical protein
MPATLTIRDETIGGELRDALTLEWPTEEITVRELIRERVYQEVKDFNAKGGQVFRGLVQPTDAEQTLNGYKLRAPRMIDWKRQFERAIAAFEVNQVIVLVNDRQAESLDEAIEIGRGTEVTFLKLVLLAGG